MFRPLLLTCALLVGVSAASAEIVVGKPLPPLEIKDRGEIFIDDNDKGAFKPWSTDDIDTTAAVQIVQYMAGRPSAERRMRPFTDALEARAYPVELHTVTTVINLDDVTFGASGFALNEIEKNKREYPMASMVADSNGDGLKRWGLESKNVALVILDEAGKVMFFKEGAMNKQEIDRALALISAEVEKRKQPKQRGEQGLLDKVLPKTLK